MATAKLLVLNGELQGAQLLLRDGDMTIGRNRTDDLVLPDEIVSRLQATLSFNDGKYLIRDESSRNGTFINDRKITQQVLRDGDVIEFGLGGPSARFEVDPEPDAGSAPAMNVESLSATPLLATVDPEEDPDAWIDRGMQASSTGMFEVPIVRPTAAPPSRRSEKTTWLVLAVIALLLVALTLFLTGGI